MDRIEKQRPEIYERYTLGDNSDTGRNIVSRPNTRRYNFFDTHTQWIRIWNLYDEERRYCVVIEWLARRSFNSAH